MPSFLAGDLQSMKYPDVIVNRKCTVRPEHDFWTQEKF